MARILENNHYCTYFDTGSNEITIGDLNTYRFAFKTGVFRVSLKVYPTDSVGYQYLYFSGGGGAGSLSCRTNYNSLQLLCFYSIGSSSAINSTDNLVLNQWNDYECWGDGSYMYLQINGGTIDSVAISTADIPQDYIMQLSTSTASYGINNGYMKDFKIYSSSDKSEIYSHFPLKDPNNISYDIIGGVQGVEFNVYPHNLGSTVLKNQDKWTQFQGGVANGSINTTLKTPFDHIQQTCKFTMEFDYMLKEYNHYTYQTICSSGYAGATGIFVFIYAGRLYFYMRDAGVLSLQCYTNQFYIGYKLTSSQTYGYKFHIRIVGDGSTTRLWANNIEIGMNTGIPFTATGVSTSTYTMRLGYLTASSHYLNGYLRNFKVWDGDGNLTYDLPMQDSSGAVDLVSGTACNVSSTVKQGINYEAPNYGYFNGKDAKMQIGTTSTLGWMNSGIFNMQFKIRMLKRYTGSRIIDTSITNTQRGFFLYDYAGYLRFYWCDAKVFNGSYAVNSVIVSPCYYGEEYTIIIKGDGDKLYLTSYNEDGSINRDYTFDITFTPYATTTYPLRFDVYNKKTEFTVRDFIIYSDYEGTTPFLSLPFQDREKLGTDLIGGLEASIKYNVGFSSDKTHILRSKDLWCKFGSDAEGALGRINGTSNGDADYYNFIHQTGVFRIEWEWMFEDILTPGYNPYAWGSRTYSATPNPGLYMYKSNGYNNLRVALDNGSGYMVNATMNLAGANGLKQKCILIGDGTQVKLYSGEVGTEPAIRGTLPYVLAPGGGDSMNQGNIGGSTANWFPGYLRNVKIFRDVEGTDMVTHVPLQDNGSPSKEVVNGILHSQPGTLKVVEL